MIRARRAGRPPGGLGGRPAAAHRPGSAGAPCGPYLLPYCGAGRESKGHDPNEVCCTAGAVRGQEKQRGWPGRGLPCRIAKGAARPAAAAPCSSPCRAQGPGRSPRRRSRRSGRRPLARPQGGRGCALPAHPASCVNCPSHPPAFARQPAKQSPFCGQSPAFPVPCLWHIYK